MRVKNISSRAHHVGNVTVVPGETAEIPAEYADAINTAELIAVEAKPVEAPKKK
jgi:hypothetical protein